ncbi:transmembrane protein 200C-like [Clinocottus analis]|uniref:transmembrane protein 200C-like n=1 Tax=Clinocottus analis TaxID=304258 RepID=UPI0035C1D474
MIATGGLLRINARRQDPTQKPHKAHTHKRKNKNKRRSEVVVVKGRLKLCSIPGLVAALGVLVLLVGSVTAALGYWPRDGLFFSARPLEATAMASVASSRSTPDEALEGEEVRRHQGGGFNQTETLNRTETLNGTMGLPRGFLEDFLDRYLCSDRLKVFGPLIMGIGIFLFICANAVLHENRDKKTKVINLRDIYSTVIDLHGLHKPSASCCASSARRPSTSPLNGLVNYVQSKSLEAKPRAYPASLQSRKEGGGGAVRGGAGEAGGGAAGAAAAAGGGEAAGGHVSDGEGGAVFSIYQQPDTPPPPSSCWTSLQKEVLSSAPLPLELGGAIGGEEEEPACAPPPLCSSTPAASCSSSGLDRGALLLLSCSSLTASYLSLSSLSHLLSSSSATPPTCRRRSLPAGGRMLVLQQEVFQQEVLQQEVLEQEVLQHGEAEDDRSGGFWFEAEGGMRSPANKS